MESRQPTNSDPVGLVRKLSQSLRIEAEKTTLPDFKRSRIGTTLMLRLMKVNTVDGGGCQSPDAG